MTAGDRIDFVSEDYVSWAQLVAVGSPAAIVELCEEMEERIRADLAEQVADLDCTPVGEPRLYWSPTGWSGQGECLGISGMQRATHGEKTELLIDVRRARTEDEQDMAVVRGGGRP